MLVGWIDLYAESGNASWSGREWIYRKDGGRGSDNVVAPPTNDTGVRNMVLEIRTAVELFCNAFNNSGATYPWKMPNISTYISGRSNVKTRTDYSSVGLANDALRNKVIASIRDRKTPAVVGIGWLSHYPLAYSYAYRTRTVKSCILWSCTNKTETDRSFYVNQGWGGADNSWLPATTWFYGSFEK